MNKFLKIAIIAVAAIVFLVVIVLMYVKFALPSIAAQENLKVEISPDKVDRGEYLANHVMVCMDCHSSRDWSKFSGPIKPGTLGAGGEKFLENMGFPGNFYSKNITPYNLKDWTDGEIYRAITSGVSKDGRAMFPVMPYHAYGKAATEDIYAVIAYIRTLDPIENSVPDSELKFPMNFIVNMIPQEPQPVEKVPSKSNSVEYGKYLVTAGACVDCHTPFDGGRPVEGKSYSGGREFPMPSGKLTSANITPHKTGIGNWTKEQFISRFKSYNLPYDEIQTVGQSDFNTIMPWAMYAGMTEEDLAAMYDYLMTVEPIENSVVVFQTNGNKSTSMK